MIVGIILGIIVAFLLFYLTRKGAKCESCGKTFSRLDALTGKLTFKLDKILCVDCTGSLPLTKEILDQAIKDRNRITFNYTTEYGTSKRKVDPYLVSDGKLHAWCNQYQDRRSFAIHKMLQWDILPEKYEYDPDRAKRICEDSSPASPEDLGFVVYKKKKPPKA